MKPSLKTRCAATKPRLAGVGVKQCPKPAKFGEWCRMHAQSLGGWYLVPPPQELPSSPGDEFYKGGAYHRRAVELLSLLGDAAKVQRTPCDHSGIGLPGCVICDPRIYNALGVGKSEAV